MVYFIKAPESNAVKIGFTKARGLRRINSINGHHPFNCEILLLLEGDLLEEKNIHKKFLPYLIEGKREWFTLSEEILKFIDDNKDNSIPIEGLIPIKQKKEKISRAKKTNPIGVRFDEELIKALKDEGKVDSFQQALNYLTDLYKTGHIRATQDLLDTGVAITHTTDEGVTNIDPFSEKGFKTAEILKQIKATKEEKIPDGRNTAFGKKVWEQEQAAKISNLYKDLEKLYA